MAHNKEPTNQNKKAQNNANATNNASKKSTPMIVERVNKIPMVNFAVSMGFSQYDKLKSSNVTVADVMNRAEGLAAYFWEKVQPIVNKLQDPINKVDQIACTTLDFVEDKLNAMKISQSLDMIVTKCKAAPLVNSLPTSATTNQ